MEEKCGPFTFFSNFDSGNLAKVERIDLEPSTQRKENVDNTGMIIPDFEYNVWTRPDCAGTPYENGNRTWFYFGIKGCQPGKTIKINIMNMNKQGKLYSQGMTPLVKVTPSKDCRWERIRGKVTHEVVDGNFVLSFIYMFPDIKNATVYFAFCYPYTYKECQMKLDRLEKFYLQEKEDVNDNAKLQTGVYFHRELLCYSLDDLRVDLITVSSYKDIRSDEEERIPLLFPDRNATRARKFDGKKIFFVTARVHPGETPSSFVFNGFLDFILRKNDARASLLRDMFVFKLIPMLNPDGVQRGFYRTDIRGLNLNRVYTQPDPLLHPSIYAVRKLIEYHHNCGNLVDSNSETYTQQATEKLSSLTLKDNRDSGFSLGSLSDTLTDDNDNIVEESVLEKKHKLNFDGTSGDGIKVDIVKGTGHIQTGVTQTVLAQNAKEIRTDALETILSQNSNVNGVEIAPVQATQNKEVAEIKMVQNERTQNVQDDQSEVVQTEMAQNVENAQTEDAQDAKISENEVAENNEDAQIELAQNIENAKTEVAQKAEISLNEMAQNSEDSRVEMAQNLEDSLIDLAQADVTRNAENVQFGTNQIDGPKLAEKIRIEMKPAKMTLEDENSQIELTNTGIAHNAVDINDGTMKVEIPQTTTLCSQAQADKSIDGDSLNTKNVDDKCDDISSFSRTCENAQRAGDSPIAFYIDLHGHASKRGCFIYANNFENENNQLQCLLYPKLMSINSPNFDFYGCNFSLKNMHSKDKRDGMSKEGSGRVAVYKATGILHSYTVECNYNTGRITNLISPASNDNGRATPPIQLSYPPRYTPETFAEIGKALAISALDVYEVNPWSRVPSSEFHNFKNLKQWIVHYMRQAKMSSIAQKVNQITSNLPSKAAVNIPIRRQRNMPRSSAKTGKQKDNGCSNGQNEAPQEKNAVRKIRLVKNRTTIPIKESLLMPGDKLVKTADLNVIQLQPVTKTSGVKKNRPFIGRVSSVCNVEERNKHKKSIDQSLCITGPKIQTGIKKLTLNFHSNNEISPFSETSPGLAGRKKESYPGPPKLSYQRKGSR